jgi:hypothetical protein
LPEDLICKITTGKNPEGKAYFYPVLSYKRRKCLLSIIKKTHNPKKIQRAKRVEMDKGRFRFDPGKPFDFDAF